MKKIILVLILSAMVAAAGFWYMHREEHKIYAVSPLVGPAVQAVYATGTVEPSVMMPIAPRTPARLVTLLADEGSEVVKGDVLGQLEDTDLQKSAEELQARLVLAEKEFARKDRLRKSGAVSKQAVDTARANLDAAKAALEQVEAQKDYLQLTAPEDGRVIKRDGEVGEFIAAGQAVFWMECCAPLRVTAEVDEEDIPLVKVGQKVVITADAFPDQTFNAAIQSITPMGDAVSRSYRVRIGLSDEIPLMSGMTAEANIIVHEDQDALLLPASAVKDNKVWLVKDGKAVLNDVKIGAKNTNTVEIVSGLSRDDLVLEAPDGELKNGQSLRTQTKAWELPQ
jgi:multidrug efflux system membrane fusion protein